MPDPGPLRALDALVHPFVGFDVAHLLARRALAHPDRPFLIFEPFDGPAETWSYGDVAERVAHVAAGLAARGVRAGDHVIIHLDNRPEFVLGLFACAHLGAVAVMTNLRATADDLHSFAHRTQAVGALTQPECADVVAVALGGQHWTAVAGGTGPDSFAAIGRGAVALPLRAPDPLAPFAVQFTSGTTSRPKGVQWTHANALWGARVSADHLGMSPADVTLIHLPLFHTVALAWQLLPTVWVGGCAVLQPRFSSSRFWNVSTSHRCTMTATVPFNVRALLSMEVPSHHYRLWTGACAHRRAERHFRTRLVGTWGMTEVITQGIMGDVFGREATGIIGTSVPEYQTAVEDDGAPVGSGETGELLIRGIPGLSLFSGYLGDADATGAAFDQRGFFQTGDRVTVVESGEMRFADRSKDMLKVGGENVAASEIELVIGRVPGVREVAVVGVRHPMLDEVPAAFVIPAEPRGGTEALINLILARCGSELADFKIPRVVRIVDRLPRSLLEKVAKSQLRDQLEAETLPVRAT